MSAGEDVGAACCGICCICGFSALENWCNLNAYGGRGGRGINGCCGSCCNKSFNDDSMDKWDKDREQIREKSQPAPSEPMKIPSSTQPSPEHTTQTVPAAADAK
ncbi:hypothetical protein DFH09DRAFT_1073816 [Mycena vulgaris]|nr:hypothetical protein DFH09DRAFT_1073816 [Mycena vulgaris]